MLGTHIDGSIILQEPIRLWFAFWILCGFKVIQYLTSIIYWEWKYKGGGDDYINFGKKYCENKCSTGNKGVEK